MWRRAERAGALKLLDDPAAAVATQEIVPGGRSRWEIQRAIKVRAHAQRLWAVVMLMLLFLWRNRHLLVCISAHKSRLQFGVTGLMGPLK